MRCFSDPEPPPIVGETKTWDDQPHQNFGTERKALELRISQTVGNSHRLAHPIQLIRRHIPSPARATHCAPIGTGDRAPIPEEIDEHRLSYAEPRFFAIQTNTLTAQDPGLRRDDGSLEPPCPSSPRWPPPSRAGAAAVPLWRAASSRHGQRVRARRRTAAVRLSQRGAPRLSRQPGGAARGEAGRRRGRRGAAAARRPALAALVARDRAGRRCSRRWRRICCCTAMPMSSDEGRRGQPVELFALRPERVTVEPDADGWPAAYRYRSASGC